MKIVIDIDENIYQEAVKNGYSYQYDEEVANAVAKGIPFKEHMTEEKLTEITTWIIKNIMRNDQIMFEPYVRGSYIRGDNIYEEADLIEVIASLHNMLYKEVTGEYYDYMFHWANKVGGWVYDDLFKKEEEKRERY